jgi:hypothetical protein
VVWYSDGEKQRENSYLKQNNIQILFLKRYDNTKFISQTVQYAVYLKRKNNTKYVSQKEQ